MLAAVRMSTRSSANGGGNTRDVDCDFITEKAVCILRIQFDQRQSDMVAGRTLPVAGNGRGYSGIARLLVRREERIPRCSTRRDVRGAGNSTPYTVLGKNASGKGVDE